MSAVDPKPTDRSPTERSPTDRSADGEAGVEDYLDQQEDESFPASDPHSDWSGPRDQ